MWIKKTIKNRILSKKTCENLTSLLSYQINVLQDNASDYIFFSSELEKIVDSCNERTNLTDVIISRLNRICSAELLDLCTEIVNLSGEINLSEAIRLLETKESVANAAACIKSVYWTLFDISSRNLKLVTRGNTNE